MIRRHICFFLQAEDGIRDRNVTGVQTCALPISQLRGLAVTTAQRQPQVPELPAIGEFVPGYDVSSWFALFVAAKTPSEIVAKLNADAIAALNHPPVRQRYATLGATVVGSTPGE